MRRLLLPDSIAAIVPRPWEPQFEIPGDAVQSEPDVVPELLSIGTDHYEVTYDRDLDLVTAWVAVMDGTPVQRVSLTDIRAVTPEPHGQTLDS